MKHSDYSIIIKMEVVLLKSNYMKTLGLSILFSFYMVLTACSDSENDVGTKADKDELTESVDSEISETVETVNTEVSKDDLEESEKELTEVGVEAENKIALALSILKDSIADNGEVTFDEESKTFRVIPKGLLSEEITMLMTEHVGINAWKVMTKSLASLSETYSNTLGKEYKIALVNPYNTDNTLLLAANGVIIFDFTDELE